MHDRQLLAFIPLIVVLGCPSVGHAPNAFIETDGGNIQQHIDSGPPEVTSQFPSPCRNDSDANACPGGLLCYPLSTENPTLTMCSKECMADAECGSGNHCWQGLCWDGCTLDPRGACRNPGFICVPYSATAGICRPDCTQQASSFCAEFRGYPLTACDKDRASKTFGDCLAPGGPCSSSMDCTNEQACFHPGTDGGLPACVNDCTVPSGSATGCRAHTDCVSDRCENGRCAACLAGFSCSAASRTCELVREPDYGPCALTAQCPTGSRCILFSQRNGMCLPPCVTDDLCPRGTRGTTAKCALALSDGTRVCDLDCGAPGAICPEGSSCLGVQGLGSYCAPAN